MPCAPHTSTYARCYAWAGLLGLIAVLALFAVPRTANAAVSMIGTPIVHPGQVTISWTSPQPGSELRWDTVKHTTFDGFPDTLPYDVSNLSGAAGRHSRTIADLPAGTFWYMVRSGTDVAGPFSFQVTSSDAGQWQVANIVPANADGNVPGTIMESAFAASDDHDPDTGKLWVAGGFDRIGRASPPALSVAADGSTRPGAPVISGGSVETTTGDGNGGWYIGGSFTHVAGIPMRGIAHILPDGGLDTSFAPKGIGIDPTQPDAVGGAKPTVYAVELDTVNSPPRLYVGGRFDSWTNPTGSAQTIHNLVAVNPTTGVRLPNANFNVGVGTSGATDAAPATVRFDLGEVRAIVADKRTPDPADRSDDNAGVFLGGRFTRVDSKAFAKVAKLEPTGAPAVGKGDCRVSWLCFIGNALATAKFEMPGVTKGGSQQAAIVYTLAYWEPRFVGDTGILGVWAQFQPELAVGGSFDTITVAGGSPATEAHANFVELDSMLGAHIGPLGVGGDPSGPGNEANGIVRSIKVVDSKQMNGSGTGDYAGDKLYVAGDFTTFYGAARNRVARLSLTPSTTDTSWSIDAYNPLADATVTNVQSIYVQCNVLHCGAHPTVGATCSNVYIGGTFHYVNAGNSRRYDNLAAANCSTGARVTTFRPGQAINGVPRALAFSAGNRLFVGGDFTMYEGQRRPGFAALDVVDGDLAISDDFATWTSGFTGGSASIDTMEARGTSVFVGGSFTHVNGTARANVAKITSGAIAGFNPSPGARVRAIHAPAQETDRVWIGGDFTNAATCAAASVTCAHLGVLNASSGAPINGSSDPTENPDARVRAFATDGSDVFVGGDFQNVGGHAISTVAKYDSDGHLVDPSPFNGSTGSGARATALAYSEVDGGSLFVGGVTTWHGQSAHGLVKVAASDGARDGAFTPTLGPVVNEDTVRVLAVTGNRLFVGGGFTQYNGVNEPQYVANIDLVAGTPVPGTEVDVTAQVGSPIVTTITQIGGQTIIGGKIDSFDSRDDRGGFVSVNSPLDTLEPFLNVRGVALPAGTHVIDDTAGDHTRIVLPYPDANAASWTFGIAAEAQDQFTSNAATYATTSGLRSLRFDGLAAPWGPSAGDTQAGAPRGLDVTCTVGGVDRPPARTDTITLPKGVTRGSVDSCVWTGRLIAPQTGSGSIKLELGPQMTARVNGVAVLSNVAFNLAASRSMPLEVRWSATSGVDPVLRWLQVGSELMYTPVPPAAFVGSQAFSRTFTLDLDNLPPRDAPEVDFAITAQDIDGTPVARHIAIAMDGAPPSASTLVSAPTREINAVYATNSVTMNITTSADVGAAGLRSQTVRREMRPIVGGDCDWSGAPAEDNRSLGTIPAVHTGYAMSGFNTGLTSGCYRYKLIAEDNVGNVRTTTLDGHAHDAQSGWIRIDTTAPGGSITAPATDAIVAGTVSLTGALDKAGPAKIAAISVTRRRVGSASSSAVAVPGCTMSPVSDPSAWTCAWDTTGVGDGPYVLELVVTNSAPVTSAPITTTVLVDNDAPTLTALTFAALTGAEDQAVDVVDPTKLWVRPTATGSTRISLRAQDGLGTGVAGITTEVGPDTWSFDRTSGDAADGEWSFDYAWSNEDTSAEPGALTAVATDAATHEPTHPYAIAFDGDTPTGLSGSFAEGTVQNGTTGGVRITFAPGTDGAGSGIADHWIQRVTGLRDTAGTCGGFPAFVDDGVTGAIVRNAPAGVTYLDDSAEPLTCYRYRLFVRDRVGNFATHAIGDVATEQPAVITDAGLRLQEGVAATLDVRLRAQPAADETVTIAVTAGASTAVPEQAQTLEFTRSTWHTAQAAAFSVIDDLIDQGDEHTGTVVLRVTSSGSAHPRYVTGTEVQAPIAIIDNDTAALVLAPGAGWVLAADGAVKVGEGTPGVGIGVRAETKPTADVMITPLLPVDSGLKVAPASATIRAGSTQLGVEFTVSAVDDKAHEAATSTQLSWSVTSTDTLYAAVPLPATKLTVVDDDPVAATPREPRETTPVLRPVTPETDPPVTPTPDPTPPPLDREPVPVTEPVVAAPQPASQPVAEEPAEPAAPRAKPKVAPKVEQGGLAKFGDWAKEHKTAAAVSTGAIGLALAKVLSVLHSMPGGLGRLFGQKQLMDRAAQELRRRRSQLRNAEPLRRRRTSGAAKPDILDELETKYTGTYDDPLANLERAPGADRPDLLGDLESRLDGFDLDEAA